MPTVAVVSGLLPSNMLAEVVCQERNWNHGTQQTMTVNVPGDTKKIIISVKNLDANAFDGTCPSSVPDPPTVGNYEQRKCDPQRRPGPESTAKRFATFARPYTNVSGIRKPSQTN